MRPRRGQAVVETSLVLMLLVTVVIFALHFAELGYLSIKVQEAANAALWDATSQKMHDTFAGRWDHYRSAIAFAQGEANTRYADFNGLSSAAGAREVVQVFTRARSLETRCENVPDISMPAHAPVSAAIPHTETGMACTSKAVLEGFRFPRWFAQSDAAGFFQAEQRKRQLGICAAGRQNPATGRCEGRYVIALDDWGFSGSRERMECHLASDGASGCDNQGYFTLAQKTYDAQVSTKGDGFATQSSQLAEAVVGKSPLEGGDENHFYLSFRGSESSYTEDLQQSHGDTRWETTPFDDRREYRENAAPRGGCWLGHECN